MKELLRNEEGQGLVEFALVVPLLITILCAIIDYGWIYSQKYQVEHAAFEGARYASVYSKDIKVEDVDSYVQSILPGSVVSTAVDSKEVSVTVKKQIKILTFVASTFFGPNYNAESTVKTAIN